MAEHDTDSLSQEIIRSKLALAMAASENEDLRVAYRRIERVACDLKLRVATLLGEVDDKDVIIRGLMDRVTELQRQIPPKKSSDEGGGSGLWGMTSSRRGGL